MIEFIAKVPFEEGLHARPASELVALLRNVQADVKMIKDTNEVNPKSILGILTLGASFEDEIKVIVNGAEEVEVAEKLKKYFKM